MSASAPNNVDIDALLDFSEYDGYHTPALSPSMSTKASFATAVSSAGSTSNISTSRTLSGPSHNYDLYRQQTGFVPGAIANTMAVNESNNTGYQEFGSVDYLVNFPPDTDAFDFNTSPSHTNAPASEIMDFESPHESQLFTVNPSNIEQEPSAPSPSISSQSGPVRLWPGAHSQAAMAKAQAQRQQQQQQQQQQQLLGFPQQQHQHAPRSAPQQARSRAKSPQPSDPIVESKITQLLNSMRAKPAMPDFGSPAPTSNLPRLKKEEEEMDEDERLLASEEGKKLSSKERRQLRNKVSARAFRSRRKEYIGQLETEVANKVTENNDLRAQNRALLEENKRLSDLTRMLLSSPSFSNFLDNLSTNPAPPQPAAIKTEPQQPTEQRHVPKDLSTYGPQVSQQQIGMAMIPEQNVDYSVLAQNTGFTYQPQVFMVETSELPAPVDIGVLSGKASNSVEKSLGLDDEKVEAPVIERPLELGPASESHQDGLPDEEFESDPEFALFHSGPSMDERDTQKSTTNDLGPQFDVFGGIKPEKMLSKVELLVVAAEEDIEAVSILAMARVQAISASIEPVVSRLELLTMER